MADFCTQCSYKEFGFNTGDLAGLSRPIDTLFGLYPIVLCEGCGNIQVDHAGNCISADCLEGGHPLASAVEKIAMNHQQRRMFEEATATGNGMDGVQLHILLTEGFISFLADLAKGNETAIVDLLPEEMRRAHVAINILTDIAARWLMRALEAEEKGKDDIDLYTTRTEKDHCPECGYELDAVTHMTQRGITPKEGDVSVCLNCSAVLIFKADGRLRNPTPPELEELLKDDDLRAHLKAWSHMQEERKRKGATIHPFPNGGPSAPGKKD